MFYSPNKIQGYQLSKSLIITFLLLSFAIEGLGQQKCLELRNIKNDGFINFHVDVSNSNFQNESEVLSFIYEYLKWSKSESLKIQRLSIGINNETHTRYQHYHNDIPVLGSEIVVHANKDLIYSVNGIIYNFDEAQSKEYINLDSARNLAMIHSRAKSFKWQFNTEDSLYKVWQNNPKASYYPKGDLMLCPRDLDFSKEFDLVYLFELNSDEPLLRKNYYINATDGTIWAIEDLFHNINVVGSANTKYRGVKPITTDSVSPGNYTLRESGRGGGIETFNMQKGTSYGAAVDFTDSDNYWNNYNASYDEVATDAHFGAEMTYDYFMNRFGRNSFDGNGAKIRSYIHYRNNYVNAFWNGSVMTYGDGNGTSWSPLTSLDICGHEVSHAVTTNSAGLIYRYESGALNESFSDIFGNAIEYFADSLVFNWKIGEDVITSGSGLRNMANPKLRGDPSTYKGQYWHTAASDNGGVHTNSGVQNYWFYILSQGKTGTNDNGDVYDVDSLGIHKAEQIAYRNLTVYLTKSSQYEDARYYGIQSAADLYGECSNEVIATSNAWYAVGVGDEYDSSEVVADFLSDTLFCFTNETVEFRNKSINAKSYSWDFGDGNFSNLKNPIHQFTTSGLHTIKLITESCYFGNYDTILKQNYIRFDSTRDICNGYLLPSGDLETVHACSGFIYDHGGEEDYSGLSRDTITIDMAPSDSAHLSFSEFEYEDGFDSIYVYDGFNTNGTLLGAFTGDALPNDGKPYKVNSGAITITHFSDPFVEGSGFKAYFKSFRPFLGLSVTPDTTVCYNQEIKLEAIGSGGAKTDYSYRWNNKLGDSTLVQRFTRDTMIYILFGDECKEEYILDSIKITVLDSLVLNQLKDTTLCYLERIDLNANASGGRVSDYVFNWQPNNVFGSNWKTQFREDITVQLIASDGCTPINDTVSFNVTLRDSLNYMTSTDTMVCQGTAAILEVEVSGGLESYDFINSLSQVSQSSGAYSFEVLPIGSGFHQYWVHFTDQCTETNDTAYFTVEVMDSLSVILGNDTTLCRGSTVNISAIASGGEKTQYEYNWGSGFVSNSTMNVSTDAEKMYLVVLSDGCSSFSPIDSFRVSLFDSLKAEILAADSACFGETISLLASIVGGKVSGHSYDWDNGQKKTVSYTIPIISDKEVVFIASDGCTLLNDTVYHKINIRAPLMIVIPTDRAICSGKSTNIDVLISGGMASSRILSWDQGLGTGISKTVTPSATILYKATVSDNCSDEVSDEIEVVVNPLPLVQFEMSPNPSCTDVAIEFENRAVYGSTSNFVWSFGDGSIGFKENEARAYSSPGIYSVQLAVTNEFKCTDSLRKTDALEIQPHPVAKFITNPVIANYFNPDFDFINQSSYSDNYTWFFGNGGVSSEFDPSYTYIDTGLYEVSLESINAIGCIDTFTKYVRVEDVFVLHMPNAFSPNNDNINDKYGIEYRGISDYSIKIYTRWGEKVWSTQSVSEEWDGKYEDEDLPMGIYFYYVSGVATDGSTFKREGMISLIR